MLRGELGALKSPPDPVAWAVLQLNLARIYEAQRLGLGLVDAGEVQLQHCPGDRIWRRLQGPELAAQHRLGFVQGIEIAFRLRLADQAGGAILHRDGAQCQMRLLADHAQGLAEGLQGAQERAFVVAQLGQGRKRQAPPVLQPGPVERRMVGLDQFERGVERFERPQRRGGVRAHLGELEQAQAPQLLGAGEQDGIVGAVEAGDQLGKLAQGLADQGRVAEARAGAGQELGQLQLQPETLAGAQARAAVGEHGGESLDGRMQGQRIVSAQRQPGLDRHAHGLDLWGVDRPPEQMVGGRVQALFAEQVGPHQPGPGLFAERLGLHVQAILLFGQPASLFGAGRGLAQGGGVAAAAGQLAPDHRGFQQATGLVLDPDAAGRDVGGLGFGGQQVERQQLQQRGVAKAEAVARRRGGMEEPFQLAPDLEHPTCSTI